MTLRDTLLPVMHRVRGIAGRFGFRVSRVWIVRKRWSGEHAGEGYANEELVEIQEGNGNPPKVTQIDDRRLAIAGLPAGSLEVGPITPRFEGPNGPLGTDVALLRQSDAESGDLCLVRIETPEGVADYRMTSLKTDLALRYSFTAIPLGNE